MGTGKFNAGDNPAMDWNPIQVGVAIFLMDQLDWYADFTFTLRIFTVVQYLLECAFSE